jgi:hypothetical protein
LSGEKADKPDKRQKRRKRRRKGHDQPITAYNSRTKMVMLAIPCLMATGVGVQAVLTGTNPLGGGPVMHLAAAAIGALTAFVLLQMGFDKKPVLVIDEEGIFCRRPDIGLIPWRAVIGLGTSKATLLRNVLMVAVDEEELDEKARKHVKQRMGFFAAFSPQVAKFEGQMQGHPTVHIPISYFSMSVTELQKELFEKVKFHGK